ncbi:DNA replication factor C complex subunit Rfc1 [Hypoxylon texense]
MARHNELELKTFELSSIYSDLTLSVTSVALISGAPSEYSPDELCRLIQENQLWLVSSGLCRIQIIVDQSPLSIPSEEARLGFLEHLADTICECPLWATLGLTIRLEDVQLRSRWYDGGPNLFYIVEHPHKSSALLSPPRTPTVRFCGIECLFRCNRDGSQTRPTDSERSLSDHTDTGSNCLQSTSRVKTIASTISVNRDTYSSNNCDDSSQVWKQWEDMAHMALHELVGIRKRYRGLRLFLLEPRPSLLEIAPAIWNAHYLQAVTIHAASFPVISSILAAYSQGRSSSRQQEIVELFNDEDDTDSNSPAEDGTEMEARLSNLRSTAEQKLWDLVRTELEPTIHTENAARSSRPQPGEVSIEPYEYTSRELDNPDEFQNGVPLNASKSIGYGYTIFNNYPNQRWLPQVYRFQTPYNNYRTDIKAAGTQFIEEDHTLEGNAAAENSIYLPDYSHHIQSQGSYPSLSSFSSSSEEVYDTPTIEEDAPQSQ